MLPETVAEIVVLVLGIYLAVGLLFAVVFVVRGIGRVDPAAAKGSRGFRLLVLPGVAALWPLLARRWASGAPPREPNVHRRRAGRGDGSGGGA